jgi:hypothetical protein
MISVLGDFIMSEDVPSGDKAVYLFIEMIALGFILYAIEEAFKDHPSWVKVGIAIFFGLSFFLLGIKWSRLKARLWPRLSSRVEAVANDYRYRYGLILLLTAAIIGYVMVSMRSIRSDLDRYLLPRTITRQQANDLKEYLSRRDLHAVRVKVVSGDQEADKYAGEVFGALRDTKWDVNPPEHWGPEAAPNNSYIGLYIAVTRGKSDQQRRGNPDPNNPTPDEILEEAFRRADIDINGGGGLEGEEYSVAIVIGHRPLAIGNRQPTLSKIGHWLEGLDQ